MALEKYNSIVYFFITFHNQAKARYIETFDSALFCTLKSKQMIFLLEGWVRQKTISKCNQKNTFIPQTVQLIFEGLNINNQQYLPLFPCTLGKSKKKRKTISFLMLMLEVRKSPLLTLLALAILMVKRTVSFRKWSLHSKKVSVRQMSPFFAWTMTTGYEAS